MSLGAVRVPLDSLEFLYRRQISFKVRERLGRVFKNLSRAGATKVRIPYTVEEGKFGQILAHLGLSAEQLYRTRGKGQNDLPLLTGIQLSCLYGKYLVVAAKGNKETSLIVHLFSADQSYHRDKVIYTLYIGSLIGPKERNMKMLLRPKNLPIVRALNSLFEILAMIEQLLLGNIYKWLALYMDKQIINYLSHISVFRMPIVCSRDVDTIKRLFDNGTLFPGMSDPSDRDMLQRNVLSLDIVIPSFETLQENIHYVGFVAKILIRHVIDELPLYKSSKKRSPTIFEVLSRTCLWLFPWLQDALAPREDWPQDSFKADTNT
ncbi:hypothetical protein C7999DRAFT_44609 [Corynascus novoguineensis]|uniref:Uncharacterized protein n=1 Tax=Corynascus novoguineensis TaxID=1126955 RepID=A0AAN7CL30_9PEZI|nr:hypothetical protein C7999DRAFT_44609 [Corynascus novoguineensis]